MLAPRALAKKVKGHTRHDQRVLRNLRKYGAPLSAPGLPGLDLPLEETLAEALVLSRRFPYVAELWPVVYALNARRVNLPKLEALARSLCHGNVLGFFLAVVRELSGTRGLLAAERRLSDTKTTSSEGFYRLDRSPFYGKLAEMRNFRTARDWKFQMLTTLDHFRETFRSFVR